MILKLYKLECMSLLYKECVIEFGQKELTFLVHVIVCVIEFVHNYIKLFESHL